MGKVHDKLTEIDNRYRLFHSRRNEMKKIKHPKRQKILESYRLSDEQKKQIDSLFLDCYGKKFLMIGIDYTLHLQDSLIINIFQSCCLFLK